MSKPNIIKDRSALQQLLIMKEHVVDLTHQDGLDALDRLSAYIEKLENQVECYENFAKGELTVEELEQELSNGLCYDKDNYGCLRVKNDRN